LKRSKPPCPENNIYFQTKLLNRYLISTNGYICWLTFVAKLQRFINWLPTHFYVLHYTLATPKNATHTKSVGKGASNAYIEV
jgi:hypothetical protein